MKQNKVIAENRKARFDYEILQNFEAGMVLLGSEVKSLRKGNLSLKEGFAKIEEGEIWLHNLHISPYEKSSGLKLDPKRKRKLLLKKREIHRLIGKIQEKGLTLIPLKIYFKRGFAKCELGLAKGKKIYDKRREIIRREQEREIQRRFKVR